MLLNSLLGDFLLQLCLSSFLPRFRLYIYLCARVTGVFSSAGASSPGRPALRGLNIHRSLHHDISKTPVKLKGRVAGETLYTGIRCDTSAELPSCCFSMQHKELLIRSSKERAFLCNYRCNTSLCLQGNYCWHTWDRPRALETDVNTASKEFFTFPYKRWGEEERCFPPSFFSAWMDTQTAFDK